jgi:hypothetical protein
MRFRRSHLAIGLIQAFLIGCGGSGGGAPSVPSVSVEWAVRTRQIQGPSAAESVSFNLHDLTESEPDIQITGNRPPSLGEQVSTYYAATRAIPGSWLLTGNFYSGGAESGLVVATISVDVTMAVDGTLLGSNGQPLGSIGFTSAIASVGVDPGQTVGVGRSNQLVATAYDSSQNPISLTPGSFYFRVVAGDPGVLSVTPDGIATGEKVGVNRVAAEVNGLASPGANVNVTP